MLPDLLRIALLGGTAALDRIGGWSFMFSQPIVGACLAGALVRPAPEWELWALRVPIGVGVLLQLLLTDASLPAAQRQHDTATAGVVGSTVAILSMARLHETYPATGAGMLWVVIGVAVGLLAAVAGGWFARFHRVRSRADVARADRLVQAGDVGAFERIYWGGVVRTFAVGAIWSWGASLLGVALVTAALPPLAGFLTSRRIGFLFAALLGAGLAAGYHAHVRGRRHGRRLAVIGAAATLVLLSVMEGPG